MTEHAWHLLTVATVCLGVIDLIGLWGCAHLINSISKELAEYFEEKARDIEQEGEQR